MAVTIERGSKQFQGMFSELWIVTDDALNFASSTTGFGVFVSVDVAVPGVALGDVVIGVSVAVDTIDSAVVGAITTAGVVTLTLLNNTGGTVDLASTVCKFIVGRPGW